MQVRAPLLPRWVRWVAVFSVAAFIFYASIITAPPETVIDELRFQLIPLDKWRHLIAYAALGFTLAYATTDREVEPWFAAVSVIGITFLYGVGIELLQSTLPGRYFSLRDAYANALGAALVVLWYLCRPYVEFVPLSSHVESVLE